MNVAAQRCKHYWNYPHGAIQGRDDSEVAVVRYCIECGLRQMSFASGWCKATGDYALDEHYDLAKREKAQAAKERGL